MRHLIAVLLVLPACATVNGPALPSDASAIPPPAEVATAGARVLACVGGTLPPVTWYRATALPHGWEAAWYPDPHRIVLSDHLLSAAVAGWYREYNIAHELLHARLDVADHPPAFEACGLASP